MRPTMFEFAGGERAFRALAAAHHERCLRDPVLNHPFSHPGQHPEHVQRLADYWAEVFGGPAHYSQNCGGHSAMLAIHAGQGAGRISAIASSLASCRPPTTPGCRPTRSSVRRCGNT